MILLLNLQNLQVRVSEIRLSHRRHLSDSKDDLREADYQNDEDEEDARDPGGFSLCLVFFILVLLPAFYADWH